LINQGKCASIGLDTENIHEAKEKSTWNGKRTDARMMGVSSSHKNFEQEKTFLQKRMESMDLVKGILKTSTSSFIDNGRTFSIGETFTSYVT